MARGHEVAYVDADLSVKTWTCPYTGPSRLTVPKFRASRQAMEDLVGKVMESAPNAPHLRVHSCGPEDEDGVGEWCVAAFE